jgi:hypothetical protein
MMHNVTLENINLIKDDINYGYNLINVTNLSIL